MAGSNNIENQNFVILESVLEIPNYCTPTTRVLIQMWLMMLQSKNQHHTLHLKYVE